MSFDLRTFELRQLRPRLRDEVTFTLQSYGGSECYVLEDEGQGAFFRIGLPEYTFLSLLDGRTTVGEALAYSASQLGSDAIDESQAAGICRWLIESKLIEPEAGFASGAAAQESDVSKIVKQLNPLSTRVPLGSPHELLVALEPICGSFFSVVGWLLWCAVLVAAAWQLAPHTETLWRESAVILSPHNWIWIALWGLGLKVIHELSHGLACLRFGGRVREAGVVFVLLAPIPYVDLTSTWRLPKWRRIVTSAAGMYAELFIAALAAIAWANTQDEFLRQQLLQLMLTASVVTLLFNANPLMRFDGYYILADLLELPNLAAHGQQLLVHAAKRWLLGLDGAPPEWPEGRTWFVAAYGVASLLWRTTVSVSMIVVAATWFEGVGLLLSVAAVFVWFLKPLWNGLRFVLLGSPFEKPNRLRFFALMTLAGAATFVALSEVPAWHSEELTGVVEYIDAAILHSETSGFVEEVFVESGQTVAKEDLLIRLSNPDLEMQCQQIEAEFEASEIRSRMFQQASELAAMATEDNNRESLRIKRTELSHLRDALKIRAPRAGLLAAGDLSSLLGTYIAAGQELAVIGNPDEKEIRVLISQQQFEAAPLSLGREARVHVTGDGWGTTGTLTHIDPRATTTPPHPALCAGAGGPIATRVVSNRSAAANHDSQELLEPHILGYVSLDPLACRQLGTGQLATVRIACVRRPLGEWLLEQGRRRLMSDARQSPHWQPNTIVSWERPSDGNVKVSRANDEPSRR